MKVKQKSVVSITNGLQHIEKLSPIKRNLFDRIPDNIKKLLYCTAAKPDEMKKRLQENIVHNTLLDNALEMISLVEEPSVIYFSLIIKKPIEIQKLEYFPSYKKLSPSQRYIYLEWLSDITKPIDIGFVFIFYYGLERQLLLGNFENAFETILMLRKYHKNNSFDTYSMLSLFYTTIIKNRIEYLPRLRFIMDEKIYGNEQLLFKYYLHEDISVDDFIKFIKGITGVNRYYIKTKPLLYHSTLKELFLKRYKKETMSFDIDFSLIDINDVKIQKCITYANISIPSKYRAGLVPNLFSQEDVLKVFIDIHETCHDIIKSIGKKSG